MRRAGIGHQEVVAGHTTPSELHRLVEKLVDKPPPTPWSIGPKSAQRFSDIRCAKQRDRASNRKVRSGFRISDAQNKETEHRTEVRSGFRISQSARPTPAECPTLRQNDSEQINLL